MPNLAMLHLIDNPLKTLILPEILANGNLSNLVSELRAQSVTIHVYADSASLHGGRLAPNGAFSFSLSGPPGTYEVLASTNADHWFVTGRLANRTGSVAFTNFAASGFRQLFQSAVRLEP
jgi:hypothetical protein